MRTVLTNHEIPHLWMHQGQEYARNGNNSFYFRGKTIYSYGSHFPIATHVVGINGQPGILFTSDKNSITTSQHMSSVRRAIPQSATVFTVPNQHLGFSEPEDEYQHGRNLKHYIAAVSSYVSECARSRASYIKEHKHDMAVQWRDEALAYASFFGLPVPSIDPVPDLNSEEMEKIRKHEAKQSAEKAAKAKKEAEERRQQALSLADQWRSGGQHHYLLNAIPAMLRIENHEVVTSRGARFPIMHAKKGLLLVRAVIARGEDWSRNGHSCRLGHYSIDRIEANGTVHAGCHIVSWEEIERVAAEIDEYEPRVNCNRCQMLAINGVPCHETGCLNSDKAWSVDDNDWIELEQEVENE